MRWIEVVPLKQLNDQEVISFLQQNIISRFDVLISIVFYNATYFSSLKLYEFSLQNGIVLKHSLNYYPQWNGLEEYTNKNLICIIKKVVFSKQHNWHIALKNALWYDRVTPKPSLNTSPKFQAYSKEAYLPPNIYLPTLQPSQESQGKPCQLVGCRMDAHHKLQEETMKGKEKFILHQSCIKKWFNKKSTGKVRFDVGDIVLKWDKTHEDKGKHMKFQSLWIDPYIVHEKLGPYTYHFLSLDERIDNLPING